MKEEQYEREHNEEHITVAECMLRNAFDSTIANAAELICECFDRGGKLLLCGNGGSAADAQHISAEFVVRFETNRRALPAIALNTNGSILTATANDFDADRIFSRQVEALGTEKDVLLAISTSGNSANVIKAMEAAKEKGMKIISFLGRDGGKMKGIGDIDIIIPCNTTSYIQEMHIMTAHIICGLVDRHYE